VENFLIILTAIISSRRALLRGVRKLNADTDENRKNSNLSILNKESDAVPSTQHFDVLKPRLDFTIFITAQIEYTRIFAIGP
jgi:hypothetical protein